MSAPRVLLRCDGSPELGYGHVGRCLAVADALAARGADVAFATRPDPGVEALVGGRGHRTVPPEIDGADAVLLDLRDGTSRRDVETLRLRARVAVLDDASERRLGADLAFYPPVPRARRLDWSGFTGEVHVGWDWVPLRREFRRAPVLRTDGTAGSGSRVVVSMGGSDPAGMTVRVVRELAALPAAVAVDVVLGPGFRDERALAGAAPPRFWLHRSPRDVASLLVGADLAVASFGVTAYELAALGVPAVHLCLADDHAESATAFAEAEIAVSLGRHDLVPDGAVAAAVTALLADSGRLAAMGRRACALVDARGADRIAERLLA